MASSQVWDLDILDVACTECGAPAGHRCGPTLVAGPNLRGYYSRGRSHAARTRALTAACEVRESEVENPHSPGTAGRQVPGLPPEGSDGE